MTPSPYRLGLIGYPLGHSLSPKLHTAALSAAGLAGEYRLYPIRPFPDGAPDLADLLTQMRQGQLHGLNVTIPHKETVIPLLDSLTPMAAAIGAVNTIYALTPTTGQQTPTLIGDNTDAPSFVADVQRRLGDQFGARPLALVLGAGGSARAVVYGLVDTGWSVVVAARQPEQATRLAQQYPTTAVTPIPLTPAALASITDVKLLVNTTPVGMFPHTTACPWPEALPLPPTAAVYDLIYNPAHTTLTQRAAAAGLPATTGLGMLQAQASLAFLLWTGTEVDFSTL